MYKFLRELKYTLLFWKGRRKGIIRYLDADAVFTTDEFSRAVYRLFNSGETEETIINYINQNK